MIGKGLVAGVMMSMGCLAHAEVRLQGAVEFGVFATPDGQFQPGERLLRRNNQSIEPGETITAKLGSQFGIRYRLQGKVASDVPLTLLYLTPGVIGANGQRHDKIEVQQKLLVDAPVEVMAYEFTEPGDLAKGEWRFMVFQGDRLLVQQRFEVR